VPGIRRQPALTVDHRRERACESPRARANLRIGGVARCPRRLGPSRISTVAPWNELCPLGTGQQTMRAAVALDLESACEVARSDFKDQPTLRLTPAQAQRLWSLDHATCRRVLQRLVDCGYLAVVDDGQYCRPDCLDASPGWECESPAFPLLHSPLGNVSASSPASQSAVRSNGSTARVSSKCST
jgi:hypothetical protein